MSKKILVVDNDKDFVEANKTLLCSNGFNVITAENGDDGFEKAKNESPDLMLLDVMMKYDQDGLDTAIKLNNDNKTKNIPIILITGITQASCLKNSYSENNNMENIKTTIEKPILPNELLQNINTILKK